MVDGKRRLAVKRMFSRLELDAQWVRRISRQLAERKPLVGERNRTMVVQQQHRLLRWRGVHRMIRTMNKQKTILALYKLKLYVLQLINFF
jgi:ABC-type nitrate/sulfonate/bicarbonate transport system ATPase subunit